MACCCQSVEGTVFCERKPWQRWLLVSMDICMLSTMDDAEVNEKPENCIRTSDMCRVVFSSVLGKHSIAAVPGDAHSHGVSCQSPACPMWLLSRSSCSLSCPVCWWQGLGTDAIVENEGIQIIIFNSWGNREHYQGGAGDGKSLTQPCELGTEGHIALHVAV